MKPYESAYHCTSQSTCHHGKAKEQNQSRLPCHTIAIVAVAVSAQSCFVDGIDDEHAQERADAWNPVYKTDVDIGAIAG